MAMSTTEITLNYRGILFEIGQNQTPFINMIGGSPRTVRNYQFPVNQNYSLQSASQDVTDETNAASAGTPVNTTRSQVYNVVQIMKKDVKVTYLKQGAYNQFSGLNVDDGDAITDELAFQKEVQMRQMAIDLEYSFLQGSFVDYADDDTAMKTRGMLEAVSTNATAAGSTDLSEELLSNTLQSMFDNGAPFVKPVIFVNSFQKRQISQEWGYAPESRNYGGLDIRTIETDFGVMGVVLTPQMPAASLLVADINFCKPVFLPWVRKTDNAVISSIDYEPVEFEGAAHGGFMYAQVGLDYGHEKFHGKITGLTTT